MTDVVTCIHITETTSNAEADANTDTATTVALTNREVSIYGCSACARTGQGGGRHTRREGALWARTKAIQPQTCTDIGCTTVWVYAIVGHHQVAA